MIIVPFYKAGGQLKIFRKFYLHSKGVKSIALRMWFFYELAAILFPLLFVAELSACRSEVSHKLERKSEYNSQSGAGRGGRRCDQHSPLRTCKCWANCQQTEVTMSQHQILSPRFTERSVDLRVTSLYFTNVRKNISQGKYTQVNFLGNRPNFMHSFSLTAYCSVS